MAALIAALIVVGGSTGHFLPWLAGLAGLDQERARTWAMYAAFGCAGGAGVGALLVAVDHLRRCTQSACDRTLTVVALPAPVRNLPALDLTLHLDGLASLFLALSGFCAGCVALYSVSWMRADPLRGGVGGTFAVFVGSILLTIVVDNVFWLFVALELMALCSADLIRYRGRSGGSHDDSVAAVRTYLFVSHAGLLCLVAGLLPIVVERQELTIHKLDAAGTPAMAAASFVLVLLGLAIKAGVTPFHFWVPIAHTQLPTNTHAMVSAVMLKIPVYLMVRLALQSGALGPVRWWWGVVVLVLAGTTALVTVSYALHSRDLKTALAYHSVENVGIILAGLGLALLFGDQRADMPAAVHDAAAVALIASLFHVVNHGLFKTLLFLGTGCVEQRAGTVETRLLGGLLRRSPWVGVTFLAGAAAIAGFPPLNGFVSEWLTLQALFSGQAVYQSSARVALTAMVAMVLALTTLAVSFVLTALAFIKMAGESLLGLPRGAEPATGAEGWPVRLVLVGLAAACLVLGLQPWLLVGWLTSASGRTEALALHASPALLAIQMPAAGGDPGHSATLSVWPLVFLAVLPALLTVVVLSRTRAVRPVWAGGEPSEAGGTQYTGSALPPALWRPFPRLGPAAPWQPAGERPVEATDQASQPYQKIAGAVTTASARIGARIQNGDIRSYLLYILAAVVLILAVLTVTL
jgi:formate hydrogenlyase subunit 3/multisubunit Na+/H+ antiporter MnhD subunit